MRNGPPDHGTRARALGPSGPTMIIRSCLVTLWALLFVSCGPTVAQSVAVFDFELIDTSLEGAIRGARRDEQERLARLSDQLRQLLRASGRFSLVDITPIASEAQASNLQACGGWDIQLARRIGAELAITGTWRPCAGGRSPAGLENSPHWRGYPRYEPSAGAPAATQVACWR